MNRIIVNGGSASSYGVTYYGLKYKVQAKRNQDGITIEEESYPSGPKWLATLQSYPMFKFIANRIKGLYTDWVGEVAFIFFPVISLTAGKFTELLIFGYSVGLVLYAFGKFFNTKHRQATRYHGAEHKVHNAYLLGKKLDILTIKDASRFHKLCGGNYLIILTIFTAVTYYFAVPVVIKIPLWFLLYRELMRLTPNLVGRLLTPVHYIGYLYQLGSTSIPTDAELEVALAALNRVLFLENSGQWDIV